MTLSQAASLLKKYLWLIVVVVLTAILAPIVIFTFFIKNSQAPVIPLPSPDFEPISIQTQSYDTSSLNLPKNYPAQLPVYSQGTTTGFLSSTQTIANKLGFSGEPIEGDDVDYGPGKIYANGSEALIIYDKQLSMQKPKIGQVSKGDTTVESLNKKAFDVFSSLGITLDFTKPIITYFKTIDEFLIKQEDTERASLIELKYNYQVAGYKIIAPYLQVQASFNSLGDLTQVVLAPAPNLKTLTSYPIISPTSAIEKLRRGQASLIDTLAPNDYSRLPGTIEASKIQQINLNYYLPKDTQAPAEPVWTFIGYDEKTGGEFTYVVSAIER